MASKDTDDDCKATFTIKADSMPDLIRALDAIGKAANVGIVMEQKVSASVAITSPSIENLKIVLDAAAETIVESRTDAEVSIKAPLATYSKRRLDPTPMEKAINSIVTAPVTRPGLDKFRAAANGIDLRIVGPDEGFDDESEHEE